jgi:hypothetical protein
MPESTMRWRSFNEKKPYLMCAVFSLVLVGFAVGFLFEKLAQSKQTALDNIQPTLQQAQEKANRMDQAYGKEKAAKAEAAQIAEWMQDRYYWGDVLSAMRLALIRSENDVQKKLSAEKPGVQAGIWIEQMTTMATANGMSQTPVGPSTEAQGTGQPTNPNTFTLVCRAISLQAVDPSANSDMAYAVQNELQASTYFDPGNTLLAGNISPDDANKTFTFGVNVALTNAPQIMPQQ